MSSDPVKNPRAGMSRLQQAQMDWALKGQEKGDKIRAKYKLKPSKLGGQLHKARQKRLEDATVGQRAKMIGRSMKFSAKRNVHAAKQEIKQGISKTPSKWARFKKDVKNKIAAKRGMFRDFIQGGRKTSVHLPSGPKLPATHPPAKRIGNLKSLAKLDEMIAKGASVITPKKDDDGNFDFDSSKVSFGAAKSRLFKGEKDEATKAKNAAAINAVLDHIEEQSSKEVRKLVENSYISLAGDEDGKKMTVAERITRGTYLSSDFVAQLKAATEHAQKAVVIMKSNEAVDHFMSNKPSDAMGTLPKQYSEVFSGASQSIDDLDEEVEQSGLSKWVDGVIDQGGFDGRSVEDYPETYRNLKNTVDSATQAPPDKVGADKNEPLFGRFRQQLKVMAHKGAENKNKAGKPVPLSIEQNDLHKQAKNHFSNPKIFSQMVNSANANIVDRYTSRGPDFNKNMANAVRGWIDANDAETTQGVTQEDLDWLADQIENEDYLDLPETSLVNKMFHTYDENRDMWNITEKMREEIQDGATMIGDPLGKKEYEALKARNASVKELNAFRARMSAKAKNPKEIRQKDISKLLGPSIKEIIQERHRRLDVINKKRAEFRQQNEASLNNTLSKFPDLNRAAQGIKRGAYPGLSGGKVGKAGQFFRAVLKQDVGGVSNQDSLDALDEFAAFQDRLDKLAKKGGVQAADPKELQEIQATARKLKAEAKRLDNLGKSVDLANEIEELEYGDDDQLKPAQLKRKRSVDSQSSMQLKALGKAFRTAAQTIDEEVDPYMNIATDIAKSGANRRLAHLPVVHQQNNVQITNKELNSVDQIESDIDPSSPDGKLPSHVVDANFKSAFIQNEMGQWRSKSMTGTNPMKAYQSFSQKSLPVLDKFAQFAVDHEKDTELLRRSQNSLLTPSEEKRLGQFQSDRNQMAIEVEEFAGEVRKLRSALENSRPPKGSGAPAGLPDDVSDLLDSLDATVEGMRQSLRTGEFIGTDTDNPDPQLDGGALARPWSEMSRNLENVDELNKSLGNSSSLLYGSEEAIQDFKDFNDALAENMSAHPIALRNQKAVDDLGRLDIMADRVRGGLNEMQDNIESLRKLEETVQQTDNDDLPSVYAKWDSVLEDLDMPPLTGKEKATYLDAIRSARMDLEAQHAHMTNRLQDYATYRGDQFPNAATSASIRDTWSSIRNGTRPRLAGAMAHGLKATADPIIKQSGDDDNTTNVVNETMSALDPGLRAVGQVMRMPDLSTDPVLTSPYRPNQSQLQSLRQIQQAAAKNLEEVEKLAAQSAKMFKEVQELSGFKNQINLEALESVPGGRNWYDFNSMMQEAVQVAREKKNALDKAVEQAREKPIPIAAIPNADARASRAQATQQAIAQEDGMAAKVAIDKSKLPQGPQRYRAIKPQQNPGLPHGAINAFLGADVVDQAKMEEFQRQWSKSADNGDADNATGPPAELGWAYLNYLNTTDQSPHKVQFQAFDPNDEEAAHEAIEQLKINGDRVMVGTQDPNEYRTFYKDDQGDWRMFDPAKPHSQPRMDPEDYILQQGMPIAGIDDDLSIQQQVPGNSLVSIVSIAD